jgi:hypothetical protein
MTGSGEAIGPHDGQQGTDRGAEELRLSPDVMVRRMDDAAILIHLGTNGIFETNRTGARICELLLAGGTRDAIVRQLLEEFEIDEQTLEAQLGELLRRLSAEGMISAGDPER